VEFGPPPPPMEGGWDPDGLFTGTPDWAKLLQEEALHDEDVAKMIEGCDGDPGKIYEQIKQRFDARSEEIMRESAGAPLASLPPPPQLLEERRRTDRAWLSWYACSYAGREEGMKVQFREFDPVNLWVSTRDTRPNVRPPPSKPRFSPAGCSGADLAGAVRLSARERAQADIGGD